MPDSRPLDRLHSLLAADFSTAQASHATAWGNPKAMSDVLRELKRSLGGGDGFHLPQSDVLVESVREFGHRLKASSPKQLKYVCYGVTLPVDAAQWRIIDRADVFDALLHEVNGQSRSPRQFRRCYQGLLSGYFGFDRHSKPDGAANGHWLTLRGFLGERMEPLLTVSRERDQTPQWLETLSDHRNLLQEDDPCGHYAEALKQGSSEELKQVCVGLGIENTSWVWEEALLAYVRAVVSGGDDSFKAGLRGIMDLVNDRAEWKLPPSIATRATAMTVIRYADCDDTREHPVLRDTCLHRIGNPWLECTAWDAHVRYEPARQMIESWLKRRLIKDFFELLSHDGAADQRRLNYWIEWEPLIKDMWFVLGGEARRNKSNAFMKLRKRMVGRERWLDGGDDSNNAFIMHIGPLLVVEFGMTGNACYAYDAKNLDFNLGRQSLSLIELKRRYHPSLKVWLSHNGGWEPKFDAEFRKLVGKLPRDLKKEMRKAGGPQRVIRDSVAGHASSAMRTPFICGERSATPFSKSWSITSPDVAENTKVAEHNTVAPFAQVSSASDKSGDGRQEDATANFLWPLFRRPDEPLQVSTSQDATKTRNRPVVRHRKPKLTVGGWAFLREQCVQHGVKWEDNRAKGGSFWVLLLRREQNAELAALLESYGFQYKPGRGFWFE